MGLHAKAIMVAMAMLMMMMITRMTMKEIMMVMTMMVVMFHITDYFLKEGKKLEVCVLTIFKFTAFQGKIVMELIVNPL